MRGRGEAKSIRVVVAPQEELRMVFGQYGQVLRVKKIKNYAFVHYGARPS